jgi:hypothetical protein
VFSIVVARGVEFDLQPDLLNRAVLRGVNPGVVRPICRFVVRGNLQAKVDWTSSSPNWHRSRRRSNRIKWKCSNPETPSGCNSRAVIRCLSRTEYRPLPSFRSGRRCSRNTGEAGGSARSCARGSIPGPFTPIATTTPRLEEVRYEIYCGCWLWVLSTRLNNSRNMMNHNPCWSLDRARRGNDQKVKRLPTVGARLLSEL